MKTSDKHQRIRANNKTATECKCKTWNSICEHLALSAVETDTCKLQFLTDNKRAVGLRLFHTLTIYLESIYTITKILSEDRSLMRKELDQIYRSGGLCVEYLFQTSGSWADRNEFTAYYICNIQVTRTNIPSVTSSSIVPLTCEKHHWISPPLPEKAKNIHYHAKSRVNLIFMPERRCQDSKRLIILHLPAIMNQNGSCSNFFKCFSNLQRDLNSTGILVNRGCHWIWHLT